MKRTTLRRYSNLPSLLHLLKNKKLTLLSPEKWDDRNDSYYIEEYKQSMKLKSVLALCFTEASETYHHWQVFASGSSGICLEFDKARLLSALNRSSGIRSGKVIYKKIKDIRVLGPSIGDLPFWKRYPFRDEKEFRILYEDRRQEMAAKEFDIKLHSISRVIVNPWMPKPLYKTVKKLIHDIRGCRNITVTRTTLVDNEEWKRLGTSNA